MAPGGKAFIIFKFPPGGFFCSDRLSAHGEEGPAWRGALFCVLSGVALCHASAVIARDDIGDGIGYEFSAALRAPQGISGKSHGYRDLRPGLRGSADALCGPMISLVRVATRAEGKSVIRTSQEPPPRLSCAMAKVGRCGESRLHASSFFASVVTRAQTRSGRS
jgi:hypothetical protein